MRKRCSAIAPFIATLADMENYSSRYIHIWPSKPIVALLATCGTAPFIFFAVSGEQPLFARIVLWIFVSILLMVAMGASIRTAVEVDADGNISIIKRLAGLPFSSIRLQAGEIARIELDRQMTPGIATAPKTGEAIGSRPSTPRFRIDIVHSHGKFLIQASASDLGTQAKKLADALNCPLEKTGNWRR